jgi:hypothetical protein
MIDFTVLGTVTSSRPTPSLQPVPPNADHAAFMQQHDRTAAAVHQALIRGDLQTAKDQSRTLANRPGPADLPVAAVPYVAAMKQHAERVAAEPTIPKAAVAYASLLASCGDCHRALGTMPAHPPPRAVAVGGGVGHMLTHERARPTL